MNGSQTYRQLAPASGEMTRPKFVPTRIRLGSLSGSITEISSGNAPSAKAAGAARLAAARARRRRRSPMPRGYAILAAISGAGVRPVQVGLSHRVVDALRQDVVLLAHLVRQPAAEAVEELLLAVHRLRPLCRIDPQELRKSLLGEVESLRVDGLLRRNVSDGSLDRLALPFGSLHHPLQDADVVAETGPEEPAVLARPEPVDAEDPGRGGELLPHFQPVGEVVAHVVADEGKHGHRVAAQDADLAGGRGGGLRGERRAQEHPVLPGARLVDEGNVALAAGAEEDGRDGNALRILPARRDHGALLGGSGEAAVWMRRLLGRGRGPPTGLASEGGWPRARVVGL